MASEKDLIAQPFLPFPRSLARSKDEALRELARPCGRFRSPFTLDEKFRLFLARESEKTDPLGNATAIFASGVPLNWQVLLRYLHGHGVITEPRFTFPDRANDSPKTHSLTLHARVEKTHTDGEPMDEYAYGSSLSVESAMGSAVGEILERYFLTIYQRDAFVCSSFRELSRGRARVLDISDLNSFLSWQEKKRPRFRKDPDSRLYWVKGETIEGKSAYIPAQLIFWNYDARYDRSEPVLANPTTSGAAGHFTRDEAILSGLLEAIERDGFLIYWLNSLSPRVIDVASIQNEECRTLLASASRYGLPMRFLNTTSDVGIPSVICALIDERGKAPVLALGAASGFGVEDTILKSAYEALNVFQSPARQHEFSLPENYEPFTDPDIGQHERIALWKGKDMMRRFSFFLEGEKQSLDEFLAGTPQGLSAPERLAHVRGQLERLGKGYEIYCYEARREVLKTLGYHVVQTVVPALIPMYLREHLATLDSKRLREVPAKLGYKAAETPNPWPHPFP